MHVLLRILFSVVVGVVGGIAAFGIVAVVYWLTGMDPGIGGGLIAMAAAAVALPLCGRLAFLRLSRQGNDSGQTGSADPP